MKKFGRLALAAALVVSSAAPVMAQSATRPAAVSYAAPSADQLGSVLKSNFRAGKRMNAQSSKLIGGGGFLIALLTAISGALGYSSLQAFLADAQDGILGNSPK